MTIWLIFASLTAAALAVLALPFLRRQLWLPERAAYDRAIYRDQLAELERDRARGAIGEAEGEAARNELSRRLIQAAPAQAVAGKPRSALAVLGLLLVPAALPLYLLSGSPQLPDVPLKARLEKATESQDFAALIAKVELHLAQNSGDIEGWKVLAPAYKRLQRWSDAAEAYANVFRLSKPEAGLMADYGEMLVFANEGMVTKDAAKVFDEALKLDPKHPAALFFHGLGLKQEGKEAEALAAWRALLAETPAGAGWRSSLEQEIASLSGAKAPALTQQQIATAQEMSAADRERMIRSMVDGLEARLQTDGDDIEGWRRLIRARVVLGETDKAKTAYLAAKRRFQDNGGAIASLDGLAHELGIH